MKQCPFCGYELADEARACNNCGRPVPVEEKPEQTEMKPQDDPGQSAPQDPWAAPQDDPGQSAPQDPWAAPQNDAGQSAPQDPWATPQNPWATPQEQPQNPWQGTPQNPWSAPQERPQNSWQNAPQHPWHNTQQETWRGEGGMKRVHPFTIAAASLAILSIFLNGFFFLPSILALVFGFLALAKIRKEPEVYGAKLITIFAVILALIALEVYGVIFMKVFNNVYNAIQDPENYQQIREYLGM